MLNGYDKSIFDLYQLNNRQVPFMVRRDNWSNIHGLMVTKVDIESDQSHSKAYGFVIRDLYEMEPNDDWRTTEHIKEISCDGCFQWQIVRELPDQWKRLIFCSCQAYYDLRGHAIYSSRSMF